MSVATDTQRLASSCAEFASVTSQLLVSAMKHGLKEPKKLLFSKGGQYFATANGEGYNQSQLLLMDVLPTADTIARKTGITLLAAPPGVNYINIRNGAPSRSVLERALEGGDHQCVPRLHNKSPRHDGKERAVFSKT